MRCVYYTCTLSLLLMKQACCLNASEGRMNIATLTLPHIFLQQKHACMLRCPANWYFSPVAFHISQKSRNAKVADDTNVSSSKVEFSKVSQCEKPPPTPPISITISKTASLTSNITWQIKILTSAFLIQHKLPSFTPELLRYMLLNPCKNLLSQESLSFHRQLGGQKFWPIFVSGNANFAASLHLKIQSTTVTTNHYMKANFQISQGSVCRSHSWRRKTFKLLSFKFIRYQEPQCIKSTRYISKN